MANLLINSGTLTRAGYRAPWTTNFDVAIRTDAFLTVVATENGKLTTARVKLSSSEMSSLQDIAAKAVVERRITDCEKVFDGTSGRLSVWGGSKVKSCECHNTNRWPPAGSMGQELLKRINAKLPKHTQVF